MFIKTFAYCSTSNCLPDNESSRAWKCNFNLLLSCIFLYTISIYKTVPSLKSCFNRASLNSRSAFLELTVNEGFHTFYFLLPIFSFIKKFKLCFKDLKFVHILLIILRKFKEKKIYFCTAYTSLYNLKVYNICRSFQSFTETCVLTLLAIFNYTACTCKTTLAPVGYCAYTCSFTSPGKVERDFHVQVICFACPLTWTWPWSIFNNTEFGKSFIEKFAYTLQPQVVNVLIIHLVDASKFQKEIWNKFFAYSWMNSSLSPMLSDR